jgi:hypothetical protein
MVSAVTKPSPLIWMTLAQYALISMELVGPFELTCASWNARFWNWSHRQ